jgi:plasmid stabilization system protein ParE
LKGYILSKDAFADLREIRDYLREQAGTGVALRFVRELRAAMNRISLDPMAGHVSSYLIFYIGTRKPIPIVRILHGRRNISAALRKRN